MTRFVRNAFSVALAGLLAACGESKGSNDTGAIDAGGVPPVPASFHLMHPIPEFLERAGLESIIQVTVNSVSDDGSAAFGTTRFNSGVDESASPLLAAFHWTATSGSVSLGPILNTEQFVSSRGPRLNAATPDGSAVVGDFDTLMGTRAFLWTETDGFTFVALDETTFDCRAWLVSDDGSVVVSACSDISDVRSIRWTRAAGPVLLETLPGHSQSDATYMSADGSVIAGASLEPTTQQYGLFRWTQASGATSIDGLLGYDSCSLGRSRGPYALGACIKADGVQQAFLWRDGTPVVGLGELPGMAPALVTLDGSVVVGTSSDSNSTQIFRWTRATNTSELLAFPTSIFGLIAMNDDGSVVAWNDATTSYRWSSESGVTLLSPLPNHALAGISGMSGDGSVVSGFSVTEVDSSGNRSGLVPVVWTPSGVIRIDELLAHGGILPPDLTFLTATVGRNPRMLYGTALAGSYQMGWVAWLPP